MGIAVLIRNKEFGLSVAAIHYLRNRVTELKEPLSERMNVARRPVEPNALVIFRFDRRTSTLIEPEIQPLVMNHASDEPTVLPHGTIHREPEPVHPEAQALLQIGTGYDRNAGINEHLRLLVAKRTIRWHRLFLQRLQDFSASILGQGLIADNQKPGRVFISGRGRGPPRNIPECEAQGILPESSAPRGQVSVANTILTIPAEAYHRPQQRMLPRTVATSGSYAER